MRKELEGDPAKKIKGISGLEEQYYNLGLTTVEALNASKARLKYLQEKKAEYLEL